jgi:hypothetical protein
MKYIWSPKENDVSLLCEVYQDLSQSSGEYLRLLGKWVYSEQLFHSAFVSYTGNFGWHYGEPLPERYPKPPE